LALAVVLAGMSVGSAIFPYLTAVLIDWGGWRFAYRVTAAAGVACVLPMAFFFLYDARDLDRSRSGKIATAPAQVRSGFTLGEALRSRQFWQIIVMLVLVGGVYNAIYQHFQPMMMDAGMTPAAAAALVGVIGPVSFGARILTGYLLDRIPVPVVAGVAFALPIVSCLILRDFTGDPLLGMLAISCTALAAGAEVDLLSYLAARYFGMRSYGSTYGVIFSGHTIGFAMMPPLAGWAFDSTGSYDSILLVMAVMLGVATLLGTTLGRPRPFPGAVPA
jgi:predicted MFS family arabinose efflux permease